nr:tyrosine-type recombinase/integrase [uncultured Anaerosporobacter sp.]
MRISSALEVKICNLDFENCLILMNKSKNRKAQIIPMSNALVEVLQEYLEYRQGESDDYLFCNAYGRKATIRAVQDNITHYNNKRGVLKASAHLYRHTFAKKWILNGGDIFRLQKILGHSSLDIVKNYVQMYGSDISVDFDKYNPLDNLVNNSKTTIKLR